MTGTFDFTDTITINVECTRARIRVRVSPDRAGASRWMRAEDIRPYCN